MFDIGFDELLLIAVVAIVVIGPKDMPAALRTAGRWIGKIRRTSAHFRSGIDAMIREAELEEMERKWKEQNAQIMRDTGAAEMTPQMTPLAAPAEASPPEPAPAEAEAGAGTAPDPEPPAPQTRTPGEAGRK